MSERLTVHNKNGDAVYDIVIEKDFSGLAEELSKFRLQERRVCIVTETTVDKLYGEEVLEIVKNISKETCKFVFPAGEENKNLYTVKDLYTFLIENRFDRKDILLALGGGVVGDLTGYGAATYLRGIDFIQIPTTLLAQSDSSVGGKTGVDFDGYKNMIGAFYQPKLVYMNTNTLKSLTDKEYASGMGEVVKHGLIRDKVFYLWLKENASRIMAREDECLAYMAASNCKIKRAVVENDFKEQGERAVLNFGHTLGHAMERFIYKTHLHGECVSIGIHGAAYISYKRGYIKKEEYEDILRTLKLFNLPITENNTDTDEVLRATMNDKKMESGTIKFVVLKKIGEAVIDRSVQSSDMKEALDVIAGEKYEKK